jgi:hypothetical protein
MRAMKISFYDWQVLSRDSVTVSVDAVVYYRVRQGTNQLFVYKA